jgi:chromosome partitioning protein
MCGEPCECPLDDPTAWDHGESLLALRLTHNVDGRAQNAFGPVDELAGEAAVGEHEPDRRGQVHTQQCRLDAIAVLDTGGDHTHRDEQAKGVSDNEPLTAIDALTCVVAAAVPANRIGSFTDCESTIPALGSPSRPCARRTCSRSSSRIRSVTPRTSHRVKCQYTVSHGGKSTGNCRHEQPVRTTYRTASTMARRGCLSGRPIHFGSGNITSMSSHCASVRSDGYRRSRSTHYPSTVQPGRSRTLRPTLISNTLLDIPHHSAVPDVYDCMFTLTSIPDVAQPVEGIPDLWCIPATIDLDGAELELPSLVAKESRLLRALQPHRNDYDYVFIDCPPSFGLLTVNAFVAAEEIMVPIQCDYYAVETVEHLTRNIQRVKHELNPALDVTTVLITMHDPRNRLADAIERDVREHFGPRVLTAVIPRDVRVAEAPAYGQSVITYDPGSPGAVSYYEAAREIAMRATP